MSERSNWETIGIPIALATLVVACIAGIAQLDSAPDSRWKTAGIVVCIVVGVLAFVFLVVVLVARFRESRRAQNAPASPDYVRRETVTRSGDTTITEWEEVQRGREELREVSSADDARAVDGGEQIQVIPADPNASPEPIPPAPPLLVPPVSSSFTVEPMEPDFQPGVELPHEQHRFRQQTILRVLVKNPGPDAAFSAQASLVEGEALHYAPRIPLPPYALHDVAWEHTTDERATFGFAEKRLLLMYTWLQPEVAMWFVMAENASVGPGYAWGYVVVPIKSTVDFDLIVANQTAGIARSYRGQIRFDPDNGLVRRFALNEITL